MDKTIGAIFVLLVLSMPIWGTWLAGLFRTKTTKEKVEELKSQLSADDLEELAFIDEVYRLKDSVDECCEKYGVEPTKKGGRK